MSPAKSSPTPHRQTRRPLLTLFGGRPADRPKNVTQWVINGFPASIEVWSADEWHRLETRPEGAVPAPNGDYVALRIA